MALAQQQNHTKQNGRRAASREAPCLRSFFACFKARGMRLERKRKETRDTTRINKELEKVCARVFVLYVNVKRVAQVERRECARVCAFGKE